MLGIRRDPYNLELKRQITVAMGILTQYSDWFQAPRQLPSDHAFVAIGDVHGCAGLYEQCVIDNWSLRRDFILLARTIPAVLSGNGAR